MNKNELITRFPLSYALWKNEEIVGEEKLSLGVPDPLFQAARKWPKFNSDPFLSSSNPIAGSELQSDQSYSINQAKELEEVAKPEDAFSKNQSVNVPIKSPHQWEIGHQQETRSQEVPQQDSSVFGGIAKQGPDTLNADHWDPGTNEKKILHEFSKNLINSSAGVRDNHDFVTWLTKLSESGVHPDTMHEPGPEVKKKRVYAKKPKSAIELSIHSSIELGNDVISETLAGILVQQGHYDQAIDMYKKLALKYPEKGAIFAATIENLKS